MDLHGIHHISAITGDARRNVDFYTRILGLRLVAKTVNQDDPRMYHLFYADEVGSPGSEMTFFEFRGAIPGRPGDGMVHRIIWRVGSPASLAFWAARLPALGVDVDETAASVRFSDPEGLDHELVVVTGGDPALIARHPDIPPEHALGGFDGVRVYAADPERSGRLLEDTLGARRIDATATWELRGDRRGGRIAYDPPPQERGRQSAGSVHHIAWYATAAEHPQWIARLDEAHVAKSGYVDRTYFHSVYFREPSGVLFEIADDGPGFTIDGPVGELGKHIILPPQLEPDRDAIVARLTPLPDPRTDWPEG